MRLVVTGRDGQVARAMAALAGPGLDVAFAARPDLDLSRSETVAPALDALAPFDAVISAAAYTAVDDAEADPGHAFRVNRDGAGAVAAAAARHGAPVLHLSTDYVFRGDRAVSYVETDPTGPINVYGASKLAGEEAVLAANPRAVVLRTSWVWATTGTNFVRTMLKLATERDTLKVVADQVGAPNFAPDLAGGLVAVARNVCNGRGSAEQFGVFHFSADEAMSWCGFAQAVFAASARNGGPSAKVEPVGANAFPRPARRPANSRLDPRKLAEIHGVRLRGASAALEEAMPILLDNTGKPA